MQDFDLQFHMPHFPLLLLPWDDIPAVVPSTCPPCSSSFLCRETICSACVYVFYLPPYLPVPMPSPYLVPMGGLYIFGEGGTKDGGELQHLPAPSLPHIACVVFSPFCAHTPCPATLPSPRRQEASENVWGPAPHTCLFPSLFSHCPWEVCLGQGEDACPTLPPLPGPIWPSHTPLPPPCYSYLTWRLHALPATCPPSPTCSMTALPCLGCVALYALSQHLVPSLPFPHLV